jgi:hypothetical protein
MEKIRYLKRKYLKFVKNPYKLLKRNIELKEEFSKYDKAFILGSAESVNKLDLIKYGKDLVITVGNFYEHPKIEQINPKIHIFAASHPPITNEALKNWWTRCNEILPKSTPLLIEKRDELIANEVFKNRKIYYYSYHGHFPIDFTKPIMSPWSVTIVALQLAIYCRIKKVGLIGVNHEWQCIKPYKHFYDHKKPSLEYYLHKAGIENSYDKQKPPLPKERLYKQYELYQQYETIKREAEQLNIEIFNADPYSNFDVFKRIEYDKFGTNNA